MRASIELDALRIHLTRLAVIACLSAACYADSKNQVFEDFVTPMPVKRGEVLVLGIVGGWERWDNPIRCIRRTALWLKDRKLPGVHIETVENHKLELGYELVQKVFDFNRDGVLQREEAGAAKVVVFGQSLGGRAVLYFARQMNEWGVPVEFAMVVDAYGKDDYTVPPNVKTAANIYQREHIAIKGAPEIRAEDHSRTKILFNRLVSYKNREIDMGDEPWHRRTFMGAHLAMEYDIPLWKEIEGLLTKAIQAASARTAGVGMTRTKIVI